MTATAIVPAPEGDSRGDGEDPIRRPLLGTRGWAVLWVTADEHGRVPALLLEWRQTPDSWQGRVARPVLDMEDGRWRPREEWLPAENISLT